MKDLWGRPWIRRDIRGLDRNLKVRDKCHQVRWWMVFIDLFMRCRILNSCDQKELQLFVWKGGFP